MFSLQNRHHASFAELNLAFSEDAPLLLPNSSAQPYFIKHGDCLIYVSLNQPCLLPSLPFCVVLPDPQPALHRQQDPEKRPQPRDE
jgi:hypothetical protein